MGKKFILLIIFVISLMSSVFAINLKIEKNPINDVIIKELDNPAQFEFTIKNLGEEDNFELYSLVGVEISPKKAFHLDKGEVKKLTVKVNALESVKKNSGYFNFVYKIKSSSGIQEDRLTIKLVNLKDIFYLSADNINPEDNEAVIYLQNLENFDFENIEAEFSSVFFNFKENFSLSSLEKKSFTTEINKEKLKTLVAGPYILDANIKIDNVSETIKSTIKFLEKSDLLTEEHKEGWLISRYEIKKKNEGNLISLAEITIAKNVISRLFTSFNLPPDKAERKGFIVFYTWREELRPDDSLTVIAKTNWLIPIAIIIVIIMMIFLAQTYFISDIILKKKISLVKTKGGEFALKVSINVKARRSAEKINIIDKLPPIVKLYERYGTIAPDRIDEKNRRIEWNIESLREGEETILSYIIYSKIGIVGKFELPPAKAIYERNEKIKETSSNRVFFLSEPRGIRAEE